MPGFIPLDSQGRSPFRSAVESKDFGLVVDALALNVVFHSPVVFAPVEGRETVGALLRAVGEVLTPELVYRWQIRERDREVLNFTTRIGEHEIDGVDLLRYDAEGHVAELVVMMRPLSGLVAARDAVMAHLAATAPS